MASLRGRSWEMLPHRDRSLALSRLLSGLAEKHRKGQVVPEQLRVGHGPSTLTGGRQQ